MTEEEKLAWGAAERQRRMDDIADVKNGIMTLIEAQSRATARVNASGLHPEQAYRVMVRGRQIKTRPLPP